MAPKPKAPAQDPAPASSHDRILMAAKNLFASRGYENTSTVAIARMAGTSESQLMKHFGSKEGLLEAIFDRGWAAIADVFRTVQEVRSPYDRLRTLLDLTLRRLDADPELRDLMLLEGRRIRKEGHAVLLTGGFLQFVQVVDAILADMKSEGQLRPELNLQALRSGLMGMFEAMLRDSVLARRAGYPADYSSDDLRKIFDAVLPALRA